MPKMGGGAVEELIAVLVMYLKIVLGIAVIGVVVQIAKTLYERRRRR